MAVARAVARPLVVALPLVVTRVAPPMALLLIEDSAGGEQPLRIPGRLVAATTTSIAVGCRASAATKVSIGDLGLRPPGAINPAFDGRLSTPTRKLAVRTVLGATLLEVVVPSTDTRLRVWANAFAEPDEITIAVESAAAGIAK